MELMRVIVGTFNSCLMLFSILLIACQGLQRTVAPEDRISLRQGGPHTGIQESKAILLEYQYFNLSGEFKISVKIKVKTKIRYAGITAWVLFVDAEGSILERNEVAVYRMDNTFKMPPEVTYISFHTYRQPIRYEPPTQSR